MSPSRQLLRMQMPKRKRKRKKVPMGKCDGQCRSGGHVAVMTNRRRSAKGDRRKIKATMARLGGGGKKKRQKIRRDKREVLREKAELRDQVTGDEKKKKLQVTEFISVSELAGLLNVSPTEVITTCFNLGVIVSINQRLDAEIIEFVANEFDHEVEFISAEDQIVEFEEKRMIRRISYLARRSSR